jgi:acyl-CoA dehydrogenase
LGKQWLEPLLDGAIRSAFAMTEPDAASSDATNIGTQIKRDGDDYVINGRKWFISGAMNPNAQVLIVMGKTDPTADRHRQQSMILVPRDTPGITFVRSRSSMTIAPRRSRGNPVHRRSGPGRPSDWQRGDGFASPRPDSDPGGSTMRAIGAAERAIELMCARADSRALFGKPRPSGVSGLIAQSRVKVEQLRLLCLKAAWLMDTVGNKGAHTEIQAIKIATPRVVEWIYDKAIQVHGAAGLSQDFPLAYGSALIRTLRIADGPDEVHINGLARSEIRRQAAEREA